MLLKLCVALRLTLANDMCMEVTVSLPGGSLTSQGVTHHQVDSASAPPCALGPFGLTPTCSVCVSGSEHIFQTAEDNRWGVPGNHTLSLPWALVNDLGSGDINTLALLPLRWACPVARAPHQVPGTSRGVQFTHPQGQLA